MLFVKKNKKFLYLILASSISIIFLLLLSEIFNQPLLIPLSFIPIIFIITLAAPKIAYLLGTAYKILTVRSAKNSLVSNGLRRRSKTIGLGVILLFLMTSITTITVGLASAGNGQLEESRSFWKNNILWGSINPEEVSKIENIASNKVVFLNQGRIYDENYVDHNIFIGSCASYRSIASIDNFECPTNISDKNFLYVPEEYEGVNFENEIYFPVENKKIYLSDFEIKPIIGLSETVFETSDKNTLNEITNIYVSSDKLNASEINKITTSTISGLTSQEHIDRIKLDMRTGFSNISKALQISQGTFGLGIITTIVIITVRDRMPMAKALNMRGIDLQSINKLIRFETIVLTLPISIFGFVIGIIFSVLIAQASSLNPMHIFTPSLFIQPIIYSLAIVLVTELAIKRIK